MRAIMTLVGDFLSEHRESEGGWGEVTSEDVELLRKIIRKLIRLKCDPDPGGSYPIEVTVVDRTVCESLQYEEIPYRSLGDNNMRILLRNLGRAYSQLHTEYLCQDSELDKLRAVQEAAVVYADHKEQAVIAWEAISDEDSPDDEARVTEALIAEDAAEATLEVLLKLSRKP